MRHPCWGDVRIIHRGLQESQRRKRWGKRRRRRRRKREKKRRRRRRRRLGEVSVEDQCCGSMSTPSTLLALQFYTGPFAEISQSRAKALPSRSFKAAVPSLWQRFTSGLASRLGDILTWPARPSGAEWESECHCAIWCHWGPLAMSCQWGHALCTYS